jgi:hypothetical protein
MTLGAGRSDNCSSIAVYPLVPLMVEKKTVDANERARQNDRRLTEPHLTELNREAETASGAVTACLRIVRP